jgi:hypothetical protein
VSSATGLVVTDVTAGNVEQFVGLLNKVEVGDVTDDRFGVISFFGVTTGRTDDSHTQS